MNREEILQHYGILGMKWGIRKKPEVSSNKSDDKRKVDDILKKRFDEMSDQEMNTVINRYLKESQIRQLTAKPPSAAQKFIKNMGKVALTTGTVLALQKIIDKNSKKENLKEADKALNMFLANLMNEIKKK